MNDNWRFGDAIGGPIFPGMVSLTTISTAINGSSSSNKFNQYRPIIPKNAFNTASRSSNSNKIASTTQTTSSSLVRPARQQQSTSSKQSTVSITVNSNNNKLTNTNHRKRYSCDQCNYSTDRRDLYRRHENIHRDEKPFRCYICNKMFNRADHVKKHFLRIHKGLEYNVKLIKRIKGVDYPPPLPPSATTATTTESHGDVNGLPTFNLTLWNDESNRLLLNDFGHNQLNHHHSQQQQPPREPLGLNNGHHQSNSNHRDVFNIIRDPCLTFCTKLSNQGDHLNHLNGHHDLLQKPSRNKNQQPLSSHKSSSSLLAPSPSNLQSLAPSLSLLASPAINDSQTSPKELASPQSSSSSTAAAAVPRKTSPPRIKQEPNHRPDLTMQITRTAKPPSPSTDSFSPSPSPSNHSSPTVANHFAKTSVNDQANRLSLDGLKKSSSILADYESLPFASLIFNTEPDPKKIDWFHRLNPVKVNTVSLVNNDQQPEANKLANSSINIGTITTDDYSSEGMSDADGDDEDDYLDELEEEDLILYPDCDGTDDADAGSDHTLSPTIDQELCNYECEFCGCAFVNYPSLHTHRYLLHRYVTNEDNYYPYSCVVCGKRCNTQKHMILHMRKHNDTLKVYQLLFPSKMSIDQDSAAADGYSKPKARRKQPRPRKLFKSTVKLNHRSQQRRIFSCSKRFSPISDCTLSGHLKTEKIGSDGHSIDMTTDSEKEL